MNHFKKFKKKNQIISELIFEINNKYTKLYFELKVFPMKLMRI